MSSFNPQHYAKVNHTLVEELSIKQRLTRLSTPNPCFMHWNLGNKSKRGTARKRSTQRASAAQRPAVSKLEDEVSRFFEASRLETRDVRFWLEECKRVTEKTGKASDVPDGLHIAFFLHMGKLFPHLSPLQKVRDEFYKMLPATTFKPLHRDEHEKRREAEEEILKADRHRFGMSEEEREALCRMMERALKALDFSFEEMHGLASEPIVTRGGTTSRNVLKVFLGWHLLKATGELPLLAGQAQEAP